MAEVHSRLEDGVGDTMINTPKAQKAFRCLIDAINLVENELVAVRRGNPAIDTVDILDWMKHGLDEMLASINSGDLIEPPGVGYVAGDRWDYRSKVGSAVIEAEQAYKQLL